MCIDHRKFGLNFFLNVSTRNKLISVALQTCTDVFVTSSTRSAYHYNKYSMQLVTYSVWLDVLQA